MYLDNVAGAVKTIFTVGFGCFGFLERHRTMPIGLFTSAPKNTLKLGGFYSGPSRKMALALALIIFATGCAVRKPSFRAHPDLGSRASEIRNVLFLPSRIEVFQLDAGEMEEKMDEWSDKATKNVTDIVKTELGTNSAFSLKTFSEDAMDTQAESERDRTLALLDAVHLSILRHVYTNAEPAYYFPEKIYNFDYSVGDGLRTVATGSDAVLIITGVDHISTGGRVALQVASVLTGDVRGAINPQGGVTALNAALVDSRSGSILWYNIAGSTGGHDLRDATSAAALVKELLRDFPLRKTE